MRTTSAGSADQGRIRADYGPDYDRVVAIKHRHDPDNVCPCNQNISPGA